MIRAVIGDSRLPMTPIYLDYNATTPLDPAVIAAIQPYLSDHFGNPSSSHQYGQQTKSAVERSRQQVASLIGAEPDEIVFTSGGSEANNHALKGLIHARSQTFFQRLFGKREQHIITSVIEHPAIDLPCRFLARHGCRVTRVPVDSQGLVNPDDVKKALAQGATLVTIMHSNNEVGTLQPIKEIAKLCRSHGAICHTDAAQSLGKVEINVNDLGVDLLSIAGHKLYAPKGVGALFIRRGVKLENLMHGAGHEAGRRAGTENVPWMVALGTACEIAKGSLPGATEKLRGLRDRLWSKLQSGLGKAISLNGHVQRRLPNTLNVNFIGCTGAELLDALPSIAASTGSACHEGQVHLSGVLKAMGVSPEVGRGAIRLSVGRFTTEEQIDAATEQLIQAGRSSCQS